MPATNNPLAPVSKDVWSNLLSDGTRANIRVRDLLVLKGNNRLRLVTDDASVFVKTVSAAHFAQVESEAEALALLSQCRAFHVPEVIALSKEEHFCWLAIEWIDLSPVDPASGKDFGFSLAELHRNTHPQYGWHRQNWLGGTPQHNTAHDDWHDFWWQRRLRPLLELMADKDSELDRLATRLSLATPIILRDHQPAASVLHGDLWSGNAAIDVLGTPVLYDPAAYFGDRETDIAMMKLFGGFPDITFEAYQQAWPMDEGFEHRIGLYQLYHLLNHAYLFGGSYLAQSKQLMRSILEIAGL